jgi:hypothetical protein
MAAAVSDVMNGLYPDLPPLSWHVDAGADPAAGAQLCIVGNAEPVEVVELWARRLDLPPLTQHVYPTGARSAMLRSRGAVWVMNGTPAAVEVVCPAAPVAAP